MALTADYNIMESSAACIISVDNQTISDSVSSECQLLHQPDSCHPESKWEAMAGEHRISLALSTVLRKKKKSTLIDLHHAAAVWGFGELFVFICLPDRFYVLP